MYLVREHQLKPPDVAIERSNDVVADTDLLLLSLMEIGDVEIGVEGLRHGDDFVDVLL